MSEVKKIATRDSYGAALVELAKDHPNVVVLDADLAAATKTDTDANGSTYPLLGFTFTYTGTQADGTTVSGTFTDYYYMDGDEE